MLLQHFLASHRGATAIEYALLISLISIAGLISYSTVGQKISATFNNASAAMPSSSSGGPSHHDDD